MAKITGIPERIIADLGTMWTVLTCGLPIDTDAFEKFCADFKEFFYNSPVNWAHFSPTVHKIGITNSWMLYLMLSFQPVKKQNILKYFLKI